MVFVCPARGGTNEKILLTLCPLRLCGEKNLHLFHTHFRGLYYNQTV